MYATIRKISRRYPSLILFAATLLFSLTYVLTVITERLNFQWDKWFFSFALGCLFLFVLIGYITFIHTLYIKDQKSVLLTSIISSILLTSPLYILLKSLFDNIKIQIGFISVIFIFTSVFLYVKIKHNIKNQQTTT